MSKERTERELQEIFEREGLRNRKGRCHGPRWNPDLLSPKHALRTMLERHQRAADKWMRDVRTLHVPTMGPVHFDYVENMGMNAFAFEKENHDFVGLYVGVVVTVYIFFASMLAHPRLLMSIGNPLAEDEWISHADDPKVLFSRNPKDPARRSFAHLTATIAIEFLFAHEVGHLMNGHVKWIGQREGLPFLAEFDSSRKTPEECLALQTLEMDADSFAAVQGLATAFGRTGDPNRVFPENWRQWYDTPRQALFSWMLAVYGLFRLFFDDTTNLDNLDSAEHPPPNVRLSMALSTMVEFLTQRKREELIPEIETIFEEVLRTVEDGHALVTSTPLDVSGTRGAADSRTNKHVARLLDHWKILRPELVPLNRGGNLAG